MIIREKEMYFISVVIPCLNEEKTLKSCIDEARIGIKNSKYDGEVIISDKEDFESAISSAKQSQVNWAETTPLKRSRIISKFKTLIAFEGRSLYRKYLDRFKKSTSFSIAPFSKASSKPAKD